MKVYEIVINYNDLFLFYLHDNKIILVTDPINPAPSGAALWDKQNKNWKKTNPIPPDRFILPSFLIRKEDYEEWIADQMQPLVERWLLSEDNVSDHHVLIAKKDREFAWEVGMCIHKGYTDTINEKLQKQVTQILKLKAFW